MTVARRKMVVLAFLGLLIVSALLNAVFQGSHKYYPQAVFQTKDDLKISFLRASRSNMAECRATSGLIVETMQRNCPTCRLISERCLDKLSSRQQRMLAGGAVDTPVMPIPSGVVEFTAPAPESAYLVCIESERQAMRASTETLKCALPDTGRLDLSFLVPSAPDGGPKILPTGVILAMTLISGLVTSAVCYLIIRYRGVHGRFTNDPTGSGPQKFHVVPTPRIGGIAIAAGIAASIAVIGWLEWVHYAISTALMMLSFAAIPALGAGLGEDLTKRVGVLARLSLTMAAGLSASLFIGATLDRVEIPGVDRLLFLWPFFAIAFTAFAVAGIANAINIIDGYNGLASGYLIIVSVTLAWVAYQAGDSVVLSATLVILGTLIGFFFWNWPFGRIFLGDGGAYLLGFWVAEVSVLLVVRNPTVSSWFPVSLLAYPIFETFFSIYRRTLLRGKSSGKPDALHFHSLVFRRLVRGAAGGRTDSARTLLNSLVGPYVWVISTITCVTAALFWRNTAWQLLTIALFCAAYVFLYRRIVTWRTPSYLLVYPRKRLRDKS